MLTCGLGCAVVLADGRGGRWLHLFCCPDIVSRPTESVHVDRAQPTPCLALFVAAELDEPHLHSPLPAAAVVCGLLSGAASASPSSPSPSSSSVTALLRRCAPLLVLGFLRLLTLKGSGYQEHVSEYGVHWNFFFTLTAVTLLSSLLQMGGLSVERCGLLGALLMVGHQTALSRLGLTGFVLHGERRSWVEQNREGLVSVIGYLGLHLIGVQIGSAVHRVQKQSAVSGGEEKPTALSPTPTSSADSAAHHLTLPPVSPSASVAHDRATCSDGEVGCG